MYLGALVEEAGYVLAEWLGSEGVRGSVAFPEVCVPIQVALRKLVKGASSSSSSSKPGKGKGKGKGPGGILSKEIALIKTLIERIDDASLFVSNKRTLANASKAFGPSSMDAVRAWEVEMGKEEGPLGKYVKTLRKGREQRRKLIEKVRSFFFWFFLEVGRVLMVCWDRHGRARMRFWKRRVMTRMRRRTVRWARGRMRRSCSVMMSERRSSSWDPRLFRCWPIYLVPFRHRVRVLDVETVIPVL